MSELEKKAKTSLKIDLDYPPSLSQDYEKYSNILWVRLEDAKEDKKNALTTAWSRLEDECKIIQDEIDRGCYSNPLDIIFAVHEIISKYFERAVSEK